MIEASWLLVLCWHLRCDITGIETGVRFVPNLTKSQCQATALSFHAIRTWSVNTVIRCIGPAGEVIDYGKPK